MRLLLHRPYRDPGPGDIGVETAAYLNGMAEAASELRRYILDSLRRDDDSRSEELMQQMDDVYNVMLVMDFPDALTGSLRRTTDQLRGVLERTRGDLTMTMRQRGSSASSRSGTLRAGERPQHPHGVSAAPGRLAAAEPHQPSFPYVNTESMPTAGGPPRYASSIWLPRHRK